MRKRLFDARCFSVVFLCAVAQGFWAGGALADSEPHATLSVDATDIARRLIHAQMEIPVTPGPIALEYVQWTPGNHNPSGPIQNVVDLVITDDHGQRVDWRRDREKMTRLLLSVPAGVSILTIRFDYIADQPSVISSSTDSYGYPAFGGLNWNTVLFYPDGVDKDEFIIEPELRIPHDWRSASSMPLRHERGGRILYEPVSLARLVDSPVIFGSTLRTYELQTDDPAPHFIDVVAPDPSLTALGDERLQKLGAMVDQSTSVFGPFPNDVYHFLILLSDQAPSFGVEHTRSTYISLGQRRFVDAQPEQDPLGVLAHEYIHSWCGKLRAPAGLLARNYHTAADTRLLWVYEGLTTYYADVVAVRSGLMTEEKYVNAITNRIADLQLRAGRRWRSVEDTAISLRFLRSPSGAWGDLRRGTAYYAEGALFWMEADALIRRGTDGRRSLDDFTRAFFNVHLEKVGSPITYTRGDLVAGLKAVYDGQDWDALIRARIEEPVESLRFDLVPELGYRLDFADKPTAEQTDAISKNEVADLRYSLGFATNSEGEITRIIPGSLADAAELAYSMKIVAVNDDAFTPDRLRQAVERSRKNPRISLLVDFGGKISRKTMNYKDGPRYPRLVPRPGEPDVLSAIMGSR